MKTPPIAKSLPHTLTAHDHARIDPYYWLRDRENAEVIDYLNQENAYTKEKLSHTDSLQDMLFEEMKGRIKQDDESVPYRLKDHYYYTRYAKGQEYPIFCRKKESMDAKEEIILDVNQLAEGQSYCAVRGNTVSANHQLLAYAVDYVGRRIYTLKIRDLATGKDMDDEIPEITGNIAWANDNRTLFYTKHDPETLRPFQIYRHELGADPASDVLVYEEKDDTFRTGIGKSKSRDYLFIYASSTLSSEVRFLKADEPAGEFQLIQERESDHEYSVNHFKDHFYITTNWKAKNFRLMKTPILQPNKENWEEVIAHRGDVLLESVEMFEKYLVLDERKGGLNQIRVMKWEDLAGSSYYLSFPDPAYSAYVGNNPEFNTEVLRYGYESLTTPSSTFEIHLDTKETILLKQKEILGGFNSSEYTSERLFADAPDGTQVPISLVRRKDTPIDGEAPLLLYAYGSYGYSLDPYFSPARLSLLNRGFIYAIAHIRGGSEMGRYWYEDGKLLKKKNTFTDFIACGEFLIKNNYTNPSQLYCSGGSAGGLLIGAVINMRPELFKGAIASVPFVDVVTTMLDEDIPLTTGEYDEWGNPNNKEYYDYMLSYSPYDNVKAQDYPNLLVTSGLHDSQVQYWEPTKWVAKLRTLKTDQNLLLLHTNMEAGHSGASGRFQPYKEVAMEYAFLLDLANAHSQPE